MGIERLIAALGALLLALGVGGCPGGQPDQDDDSATPADDDVTGDDDDTTPTGDDDDTIPGDDDDTTATDGPLAALWAGDAHFVVDQDPVPVVDPSSGHREAVAVNRTDIGAQTVYLYHRCFGQGAPEASICLSISHDGGDTYAEFRGQVVGPSDDHIFAVAPSVFLDDDTWTMVYEESNVSSVYWAESADGLTWTVRGELLEHGGSGAWDQGTTSTPGALITPGGTIYVYYAGFPLGGDTMSLGFASGNGMEYLIKSAFNPVLGPSGSGWDGAHVSMGRPIQEGSWWYMVYEGADSDFTCEASNRYGWGMARSADGMTWERHPDNPFGLSAQSPYGCGNDMPSIWRRDDGEVFVFHTSDDTTRIVRERLMVD
jgi:hypothetical protein